MNIYISADLPRSLKRSLKKASPHHTNLQISHATDFLLQRSSTIDVALHIVRMQYDMVSTKNKKLFKQLNELQGFWEPTIVLIEGDCRVSEIARLIEDRIIGHKEILKLSVLTEIRVYLS